MLSPKAQRFVVNGLRKNPELDPSLVVKDKALKIKLSPAVAEVVDRVLQKLESNMKKDIRKSGKDEDRASDLINDLGFVQAIRQDLRKSRDPAAPAVR